MKFEVGDLLVNCTGDWSGVVKSTRDSYVFLHINMTNNAYTVRPQSWHKRTLEEKIERGTLLFTKAKR